MRTRTRVRNAAIGIVAATAATIAGCHTHQQSPSQIHANHASTGTTTQQARADLDSLPIRPELTSKQAGRYEHTKWEKQGKCDTRALLLKEESTGYKDQHCPVKTGDWVDAYTGQMHQTANAVQIDHMVPEKEAWVSGANEWSPQLWKRFTNDREHGELVIARKDLNGQKSDSSPDEWQVPQDPAGQCAYTARYLAVAAHWNKEAQAEGHDLSIDPKQHTAHKKQLDHC